MRSRILLAAVAVSGCSYFQSATGSVPAPSPTTTAPNSSRSPSTVRATSGSGLITAMHDRYDGKYLKTMSFLQNNTAYTTTGQEQKSQWYEHIEIPGKLRPPAQLAL